MSNKMLKVEAVNDLLMAAFQSYGLPLRCWRAGGRRLCVCPEVFEPKVEIDYRRILRTRTPRRLGLLAREFMCRVCVRGVQYWARVCREYAVDPVEAINHDTELKTGQKKTPIPS